MSERFISKKDIVSSIAKGVQQEFRNWLNSDKVISIIPETLRHEFGYWMDFQCNDEDIKDLAHGLEQSISSELEKFEFQEKRTKKSISWLEEDGCTCHINPPCSYCVSHAECDVCGEIVHNRDIREYLICVDCEEDQEIISDFLHKKV